MVYMVIIVGVFITNMYSNIYYMVANQGSDLCAKVEGFVVGCACTKLVAIVVPIYIRLRRQSIYMYICVYIYVCIYSKIIKI